MQRRSLLKSLGGLLVIPALPSLGAIAADKKSVLRVAHLTDIHLKDKWDAPARFAKCIHHVQQQPGVDFILNGGDVVFDINKENLDVINAQWSLWHKTLKAECTCPCIMFWAITTYGGARTIKAKPYTAKSTRWTKGEFGGETGSFIIYWR